MCGSFGGASGRGFHRSGTDGRQKSQRIASGVDAAADDGQRRVEISAAGQITAETGKGGAAGNGSGQMFGVQDGAVIGGVGHPAGNGQGAVNKGDGIVGGGQAAGGDGIAAGKAGALGRAAVSEGAVQYGIILTVNEAGVGDATAAAIGEAVVGFTGVVGGDGKGGGVDGEGAVNIGNGIIAGSQATGGNVVGAGVDRTLAGAGVSESTSQHGAVLVIDEAGVGDATAAAIGEAVVGLGGVAGGDGESGLGDIGRRGGVDGIVAGVGAGKGDSHGLAVAGVFVAEGATA
ncbi:hypothetical protein SAMN04490355_103219 [Pelosinus propionicus DSM 13327]|uniref:Uncharacterized protein n=1 Tax=Pelosinus propionicus DSM 13327 TaxID=1123291 RepID=A0A1I4MC47_9FIRM|nr:hypothetical protein SAMN04490355_103219 [Pelosinus propionicus DSM 13327]